MEEIILSDLDNIFPSFENLTPSTITLVCNLTEPADCQRALRYLPIIQDLTLSEENDIPRNKKLKFPLVEEKGILSVRLKDRPRVKEDTSNPEGLTRFWDSSESWLCRGLDGNKPFSTSLAIDYSGGGKNFAIKLFPVGKLQICGCRSQEESYQLVTRILKELKQSGSISETAEIAWIDPQTINYRFNLGFSINLNRLNDILNANGLSSGFDGIFFNKVEILVPSSISKEHLKSRKPAIQRVSIYKSGKIVQGGPSLAELLDTYEELTGILSQHIDDIKAVVNTRKKRKITAGEMEGQIFALFVSDETLLTPKEISKTIGVNDKKKINSSLQKLVTEKKLTRIEEANGANPRFKIRQRNEPARRVETEKDGKSRPVVKDSEILEFIDDHEDVRARDIASELLGNDLKTSISSINAVLYRMERDGVLDRIKVEDDDPHWVKSEAGVSRSFTPDDSSITGKASR